MNLNAAAWSNPRNWRANIPLDQIAEIIASLGVPGIVLLIAVAMSGYAGGAAIMVALSNLGGPLGTLGGLAVLGLLVLITKWLAQYGLDEILKRALTIMHKGGKSRSEILASIDGMWFLSDRRKEATKRHIEECYPEQTCL